MKTKKSKTLKSFKNLKVFSFYIDRNPYREGVDIYFLLSIDHCIHRFSFAENKIIDVLISHLSFEQWEKDQRL